MEGANSVAMAATASIAAAAVFVWYVRSTRDTPGFCRHTLASKPCDWDVRHPSTMSFEDRICISDVNTGVRSSCRPLPKKLFGDIDDECSEVYVIDDTDFR
jgi:hypothetical protein